MNLIEGKVIDGVFTTEHVAIKKLKIEDGKIILGFRAEDAFVTSSKGNISAPIYSVELLGDATMITICIAGVLISVKAGKNYNASIGDPIEIEVPAENCHLFDPKTKNRKPL